MSKPSSPLPPALLAAADVADELHALACVELGRSSIRWLPLPRYGAADLLKDVLFLGLLFVIFPSPYVLR